MTLKTKEPQVIYNAKGRKTHVLLPYEKYEEIIEMLEDLDDIRVTKERQSEPDIPLEEVKRQL